MHTRPIWAEISRSRLVANYRALQSVAAPHAGLLAVVKADAYGHGVTLCAPWLVEAGAEWLGVTSVEEGLLVRKHCPQARIIYDLFHVVAKYDREVISRVHADAANALRHDKPARRVVKQAHWLLLRNRASLGDRVRVRLENVLHSSRGLWRACQRPNDLTKAWATGFLALLHARASRQRFSPRTVQAAPAESSRCAIWQRPPDAALRRGHRGA